MRSDEGVRPAPDGPPVSLTREGDVWRLEFGGRVDLFGHLDGFEMLSRLLRSPGQNLSPTSLETSSLGESQPITAVVEAGLRGDPMGADDVLDEAAVSSLRARLLELQELRAEANLLGDERAAQVSAEERAIEHQLSAAIGLGGRRRRLGLPQDKAVDRVRKAVERAKSKIRSVNPEAAAYLDMTVRTQRTCLYVPNPLLVPRQDDGTTDEPLADHLVLNSNNLGGSEGAPPSPAKAGFAELTASQWANFALGIILGLGGVLWTFYIVRDGFRWWALLSGFVSFWGIISVSMVFDGDHVERHESGRDGQTAQRPDESERISPEHDE